MSKRLIAAGLLAAILGGTRSDILHPPLEHILKEVDVNFGHLGKVDQFVPSPQDYHTYQNGTKRVYVVGERHTTGFITLKIIDQIIAKNEIDLIAVEGIEGLVDDKLRNRMSEDNDLRDKNEKMRKEGKLMYWGDVVVTPDKVRLLNEEFNYSYGGVPATEIVLNLKHPLPIFGYENTQHYSESLWQSTLLSLQILRSDIKWALEGEKNKTPEEIAKNGGKLIAVLNKKIVEYQEKVKNSKMDEFRTVVWRSYDAVKNTTNFMRNNGYDSAILVMGSAHLPSISHALYMNGYHRISNPIN